MAASIADGPASGASAPAGSRGAGRPRRLGGRDDQRGRAVLAGLREQRGAGLEVGGDGGAQARAERGGQGELVARGGGQRVRERLGAARGARVGAQELVDLGELGADAGGLAAGGLGGGVQLAAGAAGGFGGGFALRAARRPRPGRGGAFGQRRGRGLAAGLQLGELALQADAVVLGELGQLGLQRGDALGGAVVAGVGLGLGLQRGDRARAAGDRARRGPTTARCAASEPHARSARRSSGPSRSATTALSRSERARGQRLLGGLAALADRGELAPRPPRRRRGRRRPPPRPRQRRAGDAGAVAGQRPARLVDLALDALVQLGGLGLALERLQPRARLALDVQRAIQVVLRALELELRAAAALAVLAEPGGLLDQHPPVLRLGGDDRLDAPLGDDGVHLLAQAGVRQDLDDVRRAGTWRR